MPWSWTFDNVGWGLAAGLGGAAAGWWCAGFALRCSRLLAPAAHTRVGRTVMVMPPDMAVCFALRSSTRLRWSRRRGRRVSLWLAVCMALVSAVLFFVLAVRHGATPAFLASAMAVMGLLALAIIDARTGFLPDALTLPLLWLGLAQAWLAGKTPVYEAVAGAMLGYGLLYALFLGFRALRGRDGMGHGDFKLAAALGAWVGPLALLYVLFGASLLAVLYAACRAQTRDLSVSLPFGPFLTVGGICAMVLFPGLHLGL